MDIVTAFAPPRLCRLAGEEYWVDRFILADFAFVLAWLDDVMPGRQSRRLPPRLSSDEAAAAIDSITGIAVHVHLALRRHGVEWAAAREISVGVTPVEWARLREVQYARRRTAPATADGSGRDLAEIWWGPAAATLLMERGLTFEAIGRLTLDQWESLDPDAPGMPEEDPRHLSVAQVDAMRTAAMGVVAEELGDN